MHVRKESFLGIVSHVRKIYALSLCRSHARQLHVISRIIESFRQSYRSPVFDDYFYLREEYSLTLHWSLRPEDCGSRITQQVYHTSHSILPHRTATQRISNWQAFTIRCDIQLSKMTKDVYIFTGKAYCGFWDNDLCSGLFFLFCLSLVLTFALAYLFVVNLGEQGNKADTADLLRHKNPPTSSKNARKSNEILSNEKLSNAISIAFISYRRSTESNNSKNA